MSYSIVGESAASAFLNQPEPELSEEEKLARIEKHTEAIIQSLGKAQWTREKAGDDFDVGVKGVLKAIAMSTPKRKVGVIITGEYGCGKTMFVKAVFPRARVVNCGLPEEVSYLNYMDYPDNTRELLASDVIIDDLGADSARKEFGNCNDYVGDFIFRYHLFGKGRLLITTNLHGKELLERYGGRIGSRLKDLCVPIRFTGKDKREWII